MSTSKSIVTAASKITKSGKAAGNALPITKILEDYTDILSAWQHYSTTKEVERTKRANIAANKEISLAAIRAQEKTLRYALKNTFQERAKNFDEFFKILDRGMKNNDDKAINAALSMIISQIKENPMREAVQMMQDIKNPNIKEIEL